MMPYIFQQLCNVPNFTQQAYRYGIALSCIGVLLNWLGVAQTYIEPLRYLGVALVILGSFLIIAAMCRWMFLAPHTPPPIPARQQGYDQHLRNMDLLSCSPNTLHHPSADPTTKPPDYHQVMEKPPTYEEAVAIFLSSSRPSDSSLPPYTPRFDRPPDGEGSMFYSSGPGHSSHSTDCGKCDCRVRMSGSCSLPAFTSDVLKHDAPAGESLLWSLIKPGLQSLSSDPLSVPRRNNNDTSHITNTNYNNTSSCSQSPCVKFTVADGATSSFPVATHASLPPSLAASHIRQCWPGHLAGRSSLSDASAASTSCSSTMFAPSDSAASDDARCTAIVKRAGSPSMSSTLKSNGGYKQDAPLSWSASLSSTGAPPQDGCTDSPTEVCQLPPPHHSNSLVNVSVLVHISGDPRAAVTPRPKIPASSSFPNIAAYCT